MMDGGCFTERETLVTLGRGQANKTADSANKPLPMYVITNSPVMCRELDWLPLYRFLRRPPRSSVEENRQLGLPSQA
jgi:hypothetical protein